MQPAALPCCRRQGSNRPTSQLCILRTPQVHGKCYSMTSCTCIFLLALLLLLVLLLLQEVAGVESDIRELLRSHPEAAAAYKQLVTAVR